ncbi:MAG: dienelactone hydrolase family protein [Gammaproteobacteria bacterium]|nr:dienelactone hydrolase family protein [Gammaproteobacteria bacterium]
MCDERTYQDNLEFKNNERQVSRRQFNKISAGAGLAIMLPPVANAQEITSSHVEVTTPDGIADCYYTHPVSGSHAAVIIWPDIFGLRPAFETMGDRLAQSGYAVLVVNPFYRLQPAPTSNSTDLSDPENRNKLFGMMSTLTADTNTQDAEAFVTWLDAQKEVDTSRGVGTTGYCMGGPLVMRSVAAVPHRFRAGATFHGGGLATDDDSSPHLLIPETNASMLHAIAANDDESNPVAKDMLREAYGAADISAEIEVYEGTLHGWCPPDSTVYHEEQAERAWSRLLALFDNALA